MSFTTQRLVGSRVVITGTDVFGTTSTTTLDSTQWDEIKQDQQYSQAVEAFDSAVEEFFAPLMAAADQAKAVTVGKPEDPISYVVLEETVEGVEGKKGTLVHLNNDSIVLRLVEQGDTDRLVWVSGVLEILELNQDDLPGAISDDS